MHTTSGPPVTIHVGIEHWPFKRPFRISGHVFDGADLLVVTVTRGGAVGRGEAAGVYYNGESAASMAAQIELVRQEPAVADRQALLQLLPPGGARSALDCALWDLEAKLAGQPAWRLAGFTSLEPLLTTFTLGAEDPGTMAELAAAAGHARALKLKLNNDGEDAARVRAVRAARPDVWLAVDANQAFSANSFHNLLPALVDAGVKLVEQPFKVGQEALLDGLASPIPIALDESVQDRRDLAAAVGRCSVVNIKLDKSGGLTEALAMAEQARRLGLSPMVGTMVGTSLLTVPGALLGQACDIADLDGPTFLAQDRSPAVQYIDGRLVCPEAIWGSALLAAVP